MRKYYFIAFGLIAMLLAYTLFKYYPQLSILNGYAARTACTCRFVNKMNADDIMKQDLSMSPLNIAQIIINDKKKEVTSSVFGLEERKAVFRNGLGCILLKGEDDHNVNFIIPRDTINDGYSFIKSTTKEFTQSELDEIVNSFFDKDKKVLNKMTRALLVLHKDTLVIEEYAEGVNENSPLLGWSMSKSMIATLIGIMNYNKTISLSDKHLFPYWTDDRKNITIDDLLKMKSGLEWEESYDKVSPATNMLFNVDDVVSFSTHNKIEKKEWEYSSGTSNILSGLIRNKFQNLVDYHSFPFNGLFFPIGMNNVFIEADEKGNYIGSSYMYASGRDWMRFGRLYLEEGNWQGRQIIPSSWIDFVNEEAEGSNGQYGGHFWLNKRGSKFPDCPYDLYSADGYQGQLVAIIPSKDLVIVRLGLKDMNFNKLIKQVVDASNY